MIGIHLCYQIRHVKHLLLLVNINIHVRFVDNLVSNDLFDDVLIFVYIYISRDVHTHVLLTHTHGNVMLPTHSTPYIPQE
jgi:hypothetical protein